MRISRRIGTVDGGEAVSTHWPRRASTRAFAAGESAALECDAFLRELDSSGAALEQSLSELVFERGELRRKRRLRYVQTLGGAGDVPLLCHGEKVPEYP